MSGGRERDGGGGGGDFKPPNRGLRRDRLMIALEIK